MRRKWALVIKAMVLGKERQRTRMKGAGIVLPPHCHHPQLDFLSMPHFQNLPIVSFPDCVENKLLASFLLIVKNKVGHNLLPHIRDGRACGADGDDASSGCREACSAMI